MQKRSESLNELRDKIIGLGEDSIRKSYYPKLQYHIEELERFRALLDQSREMIILVDFNTRKIVDINYTVTLIYGKSKQEILNLHVKDFFPQKILDDIEIIQRNIQEELKNCCIVEVLLTTPKGEIPIEFSLQKIEFESDTYIVIIGLDISERKKAQDEIHQLNFYDPLTGLPNRKLITQNLTQAIENSEKEKEYGGVILIDLDDFKAINDTLGHSIGNELLNEVAYRLQSVLERGCTLSRIGGDEFLILIESISKNLFNTINVMEEYAFRVKSIINQPFLINESEHLFSSSIGIEIFLGKSYNCENILKHVEIAMYESKKSGKNTMRFFDPKMQEAIQDKLSLELDLKNALSKEQFCLYYQPQIDINNQIIGFEALIRWIHPTRGIVPPNVFIPLAEENGLIIPIGEWVIQTACKQLKKFELSEKTENLTISVNVSIKQFQERYFIKSLSTILSKYMVPQDKLLLELTESIFINEAATIIDKMQKIKDLGISFSMDDFGTGYSSLSSLKKLPLHELKIDQSFVRDITSDPNDAIIVKTIIGMANNLGLNVVAEGVETLEQYNFLKKYNCKYFQGYLFGKPAPIEEIEKIL